MTQSNQGLDAVAVRQVADAHAVYRLYDATGKLLYVGVTGNLGRRLDTHSDKRWFPPVASIALEWFRGRTAAEEAEFAAIRDEEPEYNLAGSVLEMERRRVAARRHLERVRAHLEAKREVQVESRSTVTISSAHAAGLFGPCSLSTARKRVQRAGLEHHGRDGKEKLYPVERLKELVR